MERVILLNADYTFLNTLDWKRAMTLLVKGKVEVLKYGEHVINGVMKIPLVLRLVKLIRTIYKSRVPFSKKNVMVRDNFKCVYCGTVGKRFTIDHVVPKAKGGKSTFENCVTACKPCNNKKSDKSCQEARMFPKTKLVAPTISEFLRMRMETLGIKDVLKEIFET
jgi:5-methylcytosine-specific restriction endonuclease McrA